MNPRWTAVIAAGLLPLYIAMDVIFAVAGGNSATFSAVLLRAQARYVYLAPCAGYAFGMFVGHVWLPSASLVMPTPLEAIARLSLVSGPIMAALILIASGDGVAPSENMTHPAFQLKLAGCTLFAVAVGMISARLAAPQHPLAWGIVQ